MQVSSKPAKATLSLVVQETHGEALVQPGLNHGSGTSRTRHRARCKSRQGAGWCEGPWCSLGAVLCRSVCFWVYILMPTEHLDQHLPGQ